MNKEEYKMMSELLQYAKSCRLVIEWAEQCDFGFDNIATDYSGDWNEEIISEKQFNEETKDMDYTESLIYYANIYMNKSDEPYVKRIKDRDVDELTFNGQRK